MDSDTTTTPDAGTTGPPASTLESDQQHTTGRNDEFLMPGPTSTSNQGTARWAISWLAFSIVLMLFMLLLSVICFGIARLAGLA